MAEAISINLDALHPAQQEVSDQRKRFNVLSCGRRWGKTHFTYRLIAEICHYNLNQGFSEDMGYMSPSYKNLAPTWTKFCNVFEPIITRKSESYYWAEIMNSFRIEFWSLDKPENIRGRQYKRMIIDEAAIVVALKEVFKLILLPTVGDLVGDVWMFSTPRGFNDFNAYYRLGQNPLFPEWASWIKPTSSNPYFPKAELEEQAKLLDITEFQQEWEGKFVALGNSPFDISNFRECDSVAEAVGEELPLYQIRYWDIANSEDGDYTASALLTITDKPQFIVSNAVRYKGLWGNTLPYIKGTMLSEPEVLHVFETAGIGGIAWQLIQNDPQLAHIKKMPAGKVFTMDDKTERSQIWAMELQSKRMTIVKDANHVDLLDEIAAFPAGSHDDWVDSISGGFLSFIYFYGGYKKLLESKKIKPKTLKPQKSYDKDELISSLRDYV